VTDVEWKLLGQMEEAKTGSWIRWLLLIRVSIGHSVSSRFLLLIWMEWFVTKPTPESGKRLRLWWIYTQKKLTQQWLR